MDYFDIDSFFAFIFKHIFLVIDFINFNFITTYNKYNRNIPSKKKKIIINTFVYLLIL